MKMYEKYRFRDFQPYLKEINNRLCSCGGHLICMITGIPLQYINQLHPDNEDWSEEWVKAFLKLTGFGMKEITKDFVDKRVGFKTVFKPDHLIAYILWVDKKEATWALNYKRKLYHAENEFKGMDGYDILSNYPVEKMWLIYPEVTIKRNKYTERK